MPPRITPLTIAHRAGNRLDTLRAALAAGVDYIEADVWFVEERLLVRHDPPGSLLSILRKLWPLSRVTGPPLLLPDLLAASRMGKIFLDLKGSAAGLADAVASAVETANATERVAASGNWDHLDRLAQLLPQVPRFYSVGTPEQLRDLRPRLERREIPSVSIHWRLLSQDVVSELRLAGVESIVAWTVQTSAQASRLLAWGVDGISSDSLPLLAAVREGRLAAQAG